ncbi:predicted protein [Sclerotinia sclerotiorum 1980 UF-70]|uniref:Uncharacterized protein n=1 Tax=Sclerotinia sclerotiorum (strain ATCC 18683 / 1980 / Ss-1) TaxID=665079 RepID=A7EJ81_SCLS1|nr:predicted protein [Sclerotinia sclerotiorum 1980 UF-70]EDO02897.1 predicted protein [Sclerotinia sclerotiorum 1980 UF-70]
MSEVSDGIHGNDFNEGGEGNGFMFVILYAGGMDGCMYAVCMEIWRWRWSILASTEGIHMKVTDASASFLPSRGYFSKV